MPRSYWQANCIVSDLSGRGVAQRGVRPDKSGVPVYHHMWAIIADHTDKKMIGISTGPDRPKHRSNGAAWTIGKLGGCESRARYRICRIRNMAAQMVA